MLTTPLADLSPLPLGSFVSGQGKTKQKKNIKSMVLNCSLNIEEEIKKNNKKQKLEQYKSKLTEEEDPLANDEENNCSCVY